MLLGDIVAWLLAVVEIAVYQRKIGGGRALTRINETQELPALSEHVAFSVAS